MEIDNLREMDKKEQERVSHITKKYENDDKIDINVFYKYFNL